MREPTAYYLEFILRKQHVPHVAAMRLLSALLRVPLSHVTVAGIKDYIGDTVQRVRVKDIPAGVALEVNAQLRSVVGELGRAPTEPLPAEMRNGALVSTSRVNYEEFSGDSEPPFFEEALRHFESSESNDLRLKDPSELGMARATAPDAAMSLSDFSYKTAPLRAGQLAGNHFRIVLRDINLDVTEADIRGAVDSLAVKGFQNFYGTQRFSWFRGIDDASYALLQRDWARFFYGLLDTWETSQTARELLQRRRRFPLPIQNIFRRNCVKFIKRHAFLQPKDFDGFPALNRCPPIGAAHDHLIDKRETRFIRAIQHAFAELDPAISHLTVVKFSCYLWNTAVSARFDLFGDAVLDGDWVLPPERRDELLNVAPSVQNKLLEVVTPANRHRFTIFDVVHPSFGFNETPLPDNAVADIYAALCDEYGLSWSTPYPKFGIRGLEEGPRRIAIRPGGVTGTVDTVARTVTLEFMLPRGCYATVALREFMSTSLCANAPAHRWGTRPDMESELLGRDPAALDTFDDFYHRISDEYRTEDRETPEVDTPLWEMPEEQLNRRNPDLAAGVERYVEESLYRGRVEQRELQQEQMLKYLFEEDLFLEMPAHERAKYQEHFVPMKKNASAGDTRSKARKRLARIRGVPSRMPRPVRGALTREGKSRASSAPFLDDAWNIWV